MPTVAIVIPHFNQLEYLSECLDSVKAQTFTDWEAIVIDDASTNGDAETVITKFNDARFKLIRHAKNRGQGAARNTGIQEADAEFVLPLDADDLLHPTFLEATTAILKSQP